MSRLLAARSPVGQPGCAVTLAPGGEVHLWQARWRARPDRTSATMTVARAVRHRRRWSTPFATSSVTASSIAADDANVVRLVLAPATALDGFLRCVTGVGKLGSAAGVGG
jgi:hypothetical protein